MGFEIAHQEGDAEIGGDSGDESGDNGKPGDAAAGRPVVMQQLGHFEHRGADDDRRRDEEGEARRILVMKPGEQAADHGDAGARDAWNEGGALPQPDHQRAAPIQRRELRRSAGGAALQPLADEGTKPLTMRKKAATDGTPNNPRRNLFSAKPTMAAGIVAMMMRTSRRSSALRGRSVGRPRTARRSWIQSRQK